MTPFLIVLHILVCIFLIMFVLLQPGARGGVGAAFGGAGGQTVFGGRGANTFLAKLTAASAVVFMLTSVSLSYFVSRTGSVMAGREQPAATEEPKDGEKPAEGVPGADGAKPAEAVPAAAGVARVETPPPEKPAAPPVAPP